MRTRRLNKYVAVVVDAKGVTSEYLYTSTAGSRGDAEEEARESLRQQGGTLVEMTPVAENGSGAQGRRLLVVAGFTFVLCGTAIAATMIIGLTLEGAL